MQKVTLAVRRHSNADGEPACFQRYEVEIGDRASVLDALFAVQRTAAPDLAFRFSCRVGMCGSCAMVVNGRERLACSTLARSIGTELRIEPLRNLPLLRDLVVDLKPFFQTYQRALPHFVPKDGLADFAVIPEESAEGRALDRQPQCIDCASCYSACSLVTLHPRYLGPMALHRALTLIVDPRDAAREERLDVISGEAGVFRCHTLGNCREACPRGISPTASIERLKRLSLGNQIRGIFSRIFG